MDYDPLDRRRETNYEEAWRFEFRWLVRWLPGRPAASYQNLGIIALVYIGAQRISFCVDIIDDETFLFFFHFFQYFNSLTLLSM